MLRGIRRWALATLTPARIETALTEMVGAPVRARLRRTESSSRRRPLSGALAVTLSPAFGMSGSDDVDAFRVEVEAALAVACVAGALRRPVPLMGEPRSTPWLAGAFAAIVVAALRRAHAGMVFRVTRVETAVPEGDDTWWSERDAAGVTWTVIVGDDAFLARIAIPRARMAIAPDPPWTSGALRSLGAVPLTLPLVAAAWHATPTDIGALRSGDVLIPEAWSATPSSDGTWTGELTLAAPLASHGVRARIGADGAVVLGGELEAWGDSSHDSRGEERAETMIEPDDTDDETSVLIAGIGAVPVVVRVEVGEATLAARDWAALDRGDVIPLGRRLGDRVLLRIGGVPVARGELVDIEGEVGVRIAERFADDDRTVRR